MESLVETFGAVPTVPGKPTLVMANTVKGKGVSLPKIILRGIIMCRTIHELSQALAELSAALELLSQEGQVR